MLREILDQEMIKNGMIINISYQLGHLSEIGVLMKLDYDLIRRTSIKNLKEDYSIDIDEIIRVELQRISELLLRLSDSQEEWMGFL